jgi:hypothetical protein
MFKVGGHPKRILVFKNEKERVFRFEIKTMGDEKWKLISGYDNYEISDLGNVRNIKTGHFLKPTPRNGYPAVSLSKKNTRKTFSIHTLVSYAFLGKRNGYFVNHKDGNKLNNQLGNLEWVTPKQNCAHALNSKLRNPSCKVVIRYDMSHKMIDEYKSIKEASERLKISAKHISAVCNGKRRTAGKYFWEFSEDKFKKVEIDTSEYSPTKFSKMYLVSRSGKVYSCQMKRFMIPKKLPGGYLSVKLSKDNIHKDFYVHRLIAEAFIPNEDNKPFVNHKNFDKTDNRDVNLEWCTSSENVKYNQNKQCIQVNLIPSDISNDIVV